MQFLLPLKEVQVHLRCGRLILKKKNPLKIYKFSDQLSCAISYFRDYTLIAPIKSNFCSCYCTTEGLLKKTKQTNTPTPPPKKTKPIPFLLGIVNMWNPAVENVTLQFVVVTNLRLYSNTSVLFLVTNLEFSTYNVKVILVSVQAIYFGYHMYFRGV